VTVAPVEGGVGGQFWSVYVPATVAGDAAVTAVLEQIDLVHRMIARYPARFQLALTAGDVDQAFQAGRIASLLGAEGGLDHVGIGGDFDGTTITPVGLDDVSRYPALFAELQHRHWSDQDLQALAGANILRTLASDGKHGESRPGVGKLAGDE
jgi:microsomal dipeptidase-like Zn-dependent dipeptidase